MDTMPGAADMIADALPIPDLSTWVPTDKDLHVETHAPILWHEPFPPSVQVTLVSWDNPKGTVTNSNLELLAASIAH